MSLSPLPPSQPSLASPSSSSRKRSINELDDPSIPSPGHKRPLFDYASENQENRDPTLFDPSKEPLKSSGQSVPLLPHSSADKSVRTADLAIMSGSKESTPACEASAETRSTQQVTSVSPAKSLGDSTPAAKKRKLSPASQDTKQQEKEARERQRLEEKAKKEEEKRLKAEEKKRRDEEREEEKRIKEEEKKKREAEREEKKKAKDEERAAKEAAKEEEKRRKEEERLKKERV